MNHRPPDKGPPIHLRDDKSSSPGGTRLSWDVITRVAIIGIFIILLLAGLSYARPLLLPVTLAIVVGIVLMPLLTWLAQHRIPHWLSALVLVTAMFAALSSLTALLADPVRDWTDRAPEFGQILRERLQFFDRPIAAINGLRESLVGPTADDESSVKIDIFSSLLQPALAVLTPAAGQLVVFFATLFFFLAGREGLRRQLMAFTADRETRLEALHILSDVESKLVRYLVTITGINIVLGFLLAVATYLIGLPNPLVWGVLAFFMNYVPYLGAAVVVIMLFAVGIMSFESLGYALIAPILYVGLSTIEGQFVMPSLVGLRIALSPLLVFFSVVFWVWLWGPFGALLAVPLLIIGMVVLQHLFPKHQVKLPG